MYIHVLLQGMTLDEIMDQLHSLDGDLIVETFQERYVLYVVCM